MYRSEYTKKDISKILKFHKICGYYDMYWFKGGDGNDYFFGKREYENMWFKYAFFITKKLKGNGIEILREFYNSRLDTITDIEDLSEYFSELLKHRYVICDIDFFVNYLKDNKNCRYTKCYILEPNQKFKKYEILNIQALYSVCCRQIGYSDKIYIPRLKLC